jgi:hypothetical protein
MTNEPIETVAQRELNAFRRQIREMKAEDMNLIDIERKVQDRIKALGREMMVEAMKRADTKSPEVEIDGKRWGNRRTTPGTYQSAFGAFEVERSVYQQAGRGRVAIPMDLRLGIVEGAYTPLMARVVTRATAVMPEEEAAGYPFTGESMCSMPHCVRSISHLA